MKKIFLIIALLFSVVMTSQQQTSIYKWNAAITYNINDLISLNGVIYKATTSNTNDTPPSANWELTAGIGDVTAVNTPVLNDFARWTTGTSIEGRTYAETRTDLGLVIGTDVQAFSTILENTTASYTTTAASAIGINSLKETNANHSGDVSGDAVLTIGADKILESHLKSVNAPTDEYVLTYEATTGDFEWQVGGDLSGYATKSVDAKAQTVSYTTISADNGKHIDMSGGTTITLSDDAAAFAVNEQLHVFNNTVAALTFAYGTGDAAIQGALPDLAVGQYAWCTLKAANTWSVIVGGASGGGDVTKDGTAVDNQVAVWTGDGSLEGTSTMILDASYFTLTNRGVKAQNSVHVLANTVSRGYSIGYTGFTDNYGYFKNSVSDLSGWGGTGTNTFLASGTEGGNLILAATEASKEVVIQNDPLTGDGAMNRDYADLRYAAFGSGGGTIGGSITDNQIAVGAATANSIEGSLGLTYSGGSLGIAPTTGAALLNLNPDLGQGTISILQTGDYDMKFELVGTADYSFFAGAVERLNISDTGIININNDVVFSTGDDPTVDFGGSAIYGAGYLNTNELVTGTLAETKANTVVFATAAVGDITLTIPDTWTQKSGAQITIVNISDYIVTIDVSGTATLNGSGTNTVILGASDNTGNESVQFIQSVDGSDDWYTIGKY